MGVRRLAVTVLSLLLATATALTLIHQMASPTADPPTARAGYAYDLAFHHASTLSSAALSDTVEPGEHSGRRSTTEGSLRAARGVGAEAATGPLALPESSLPSAAEAQQLVQDAEPVGSALKSDVFHRAATFASENIAQDGSVYRIVGGDGVETTLIQSPGELNGISGRFEWIVNDQGQLVHQMFVKGGSINGLPISP